MNKLLTKIFVLDKSKTMRRIKLKNIAEDAEISPQLFSNTLKGIR